MPEFEPEEIGTATEAATAGETSGDSAPDNNTELTGEPNGAPTGLHAATATTATDASGGPKKRRRRGSRGGRGRKKLADETGTDPSSVAAEGPDGGALDEATPGGEDWTDESADRGLTSEDLGDDAREEAGLPARRNGGRPQIGDTRPAPPNGAPKIRPKVGDSRPPPVRVGAPDEDGDEDLPKRKRRRRGGRGRGKPGDDTVRPGATAVATYIDAATDVSDVDVDGTAILETLDEETLERRRGSRRKGRPAGRYLMVVHQRADGMAHIGVLEGRTLVEHYVALPTDDTTSIDGNIYLGRVQNVLPGMEAAFVDIGTPKNGVLYRGDVVHDPGDTDGKEPPRIERVLRNGQSIIVQVTKNPIGHKGARLTQEVSLAGRFVVMVPGQPQTYGISKRLPDDERKRLRRVLDRLRPNDAGLIVRTAAEGATDDELERDMRRLNGQWEQISDLARRAKPGSQLYKEPPLAIRLIREEFTKEYRGVVIDAPELYEEVRSYVDAIAPELADRIEYYDAVEENLPLFEKFHVHEQLHKALDRKVWLPSGGSLVVERTEALTVIDVNTGKNVGTSNLEETVYRNNLEAAEAIARELRLRDIGGIIVIDFIDMEIKANREAVEEQFRQALARDKTRTQVFPISELGLLEMTRKRVSEGLVEAFSSTCPHCSGRGFVVDESMLE
jgi:ribonuclease E